MVERLLELPEVTCSTRILTCLSFRKEIETWRLVDRFFAAGCQVHVPSADPRDRQLHVHRYPRDLQKLPFGPRQPSRGTSELKAEAINRGVERLERRIDVENVAT